MKKKILIIGGTSGVGLELAKYYATDGHTVCVTGSRSPDIDGIQFQELAIGDDANQLVAGVNRVLAGFEGVNTLVYSAGFLQRGHIDELSDSACRR